MIAAIRNNMAWHAVPIAGLAGAVAYLIVTVILTPLMQQVSPVLPFRYTAALLLGQDALTQAGILPVIVGIIVHALLSLVFALVIAVVIHRWGLVVGILGGAVLGLAVYGINMYMLTRLFDWYFAINSPVVLIAHVIFGAVVGGVYESLDTYDEDITPEAPHV